MRTALKAIIAGLLVVACTSSADEQSVLWREDFSGFKAGDKPAGYHAGKGEIGSEAGRNFYRFPGDFMGGFDYFGARHWQDYDLRFKLRPQGSFALYTVAKAGGWRGTTPYMWYYLTLTADRIEPYAHGLPASVTNAVLPAAKIEPPLRTNTWYDIHVRVTASNIAIRAASDGGKDDRLLWEHQVLPGGGGVDFHGSGSFDLADIVVEELPGK